MIVINEQLLVVFFKYCMYSQDSSGISCYYYAKYVIIVTSKVSFQRGLRFHVLIM